MNDLILVPDEQAQRIVYKDVNEITFLIANAVGFHQPGKSKCSLQI